jgi:hypothetical protein
VKVCDSSIIAAHVIPEMYKESVETYKSGWALNQTFALEIKNINNEKEDGINHYPKQKEPQSFD